LTKIILGLSLATLLFGGGIWAAISGGSLSQNKDAWGVARQSVRVSKLTNLVPRRTVAETQSLTRFTVGSTKFTPQEESPNDER